MIFTFLTRKLCTCQNESESALTPFLFPRLERELLAKQDPEQNPKVERVIGRKCEWFSPQDTLLWQHNISLGWWQLQHTIGNDQVMNVLHILWRQTKVFFMTLAIVQTMTNPSWFPDRESTRKYRKVKSASLPRVFQLKKHHLPNSSLSSRGHYLALLFRWTAVGEGVPRHF